MFSVTKISLSLRFPKNGNFRNEITMMHLKFEFGFIWDLF